MDVAAAAAQFAESNLCTVSVEVGVGGGTRDHRARLRGAVSVHGTKQGARDWKLKTKPARLSACKYAPARGASRQGAPAFPRLPPPAHSAARTRPGAAGGLRGARPAEGRPLSLPAAPTHTRGFVRGRCGAKRAPKRARRAPFRSRSRRPVTPTVATAVSPGMSTGCPTPGYPLTHPHQAPRTWTQVPVPGSRFQVPGPRSQVPGPHAPAAFLPLLLQAPNSPCCAHAARRCWQPASSSPSSGKVAAGLARAREAASASESSSEAAPEASSSSSASCGYISWLQFISFRPVVLS
jgi:hypothetical protein